MKVRAFLILVVTLLVSCNKSSIENKEPIKETIAVTSEVLEFSSEIWKGSDIYQRGSFINEIKKKKILSGLSKPEIILLLGEPDKINDESIVYTVNIGAKLNDGTPINHFLYIFFDENDLYQYSRLFD